MGEMEYKQVNGIVRNTSLDHIGIIVKDIKIAREKFVKLFGAPMLSEDFSPQKIVLDKYKINNCSIEVFEPYPDNHSLWEFLSKRGEGIHHICISGITDEEIEQIKSLGYQLIYSDWQKGSDNSQINFIHPSGLCRVLLELKK